MPMFPNLNDLVGPEAVDHRIRTFIGDGTAMIRVDGLVSLDGVTIDGVSIPLEEDRDITRQAPGRGVEAISVRLPMVAVETLPDGSRVLLRSRLCNDGLWQSGSLVAVRGEWIDVEEGGDRTSAAAKHSRRGTR